jgi:transketolase
MRTNFIRELTRIAESDKRIILTVGDLGYSVVETFKQKYPERFINMGVAEQNMMGVAAGLALSGNIVFTYSFINFTTFRCLEQIRNDIAYHNLNVKFIGIGTGFSYGSLGMTHHGVEDIPIISSIPNITIISPCDPIESELCVKEVIRHEGPCYIRIRKHGEKPIHKSTPEFTIGKGIILQEGDDITLISYGWILNNVIASARLLEKDGLSVRIISMHTIKPIDAELVIDSAKKTGILISIEDQSVYGLSAQILQTLSNASIYDTRVLTLGLNDNKLNNIRGRVGDEEYYLKQTRLDAVGIYSDIKTFLSQIQFQKEI